MDDSNSGFSFGARPRPAGPPADEDIEAIEVSGEPVSREEARQMGIASYDSGGAKEGKDAKDTKDAKASTNILHMDQLTQDIGGELAHKLEQAWTHLKRNEIDQALTLAQEVVWQYPALVAAKIIIARCFINRKEYEKALAILQAISENEMSAETMYYIGLCQSRLGRVTEAMASLKLSRASSTDSITKRRANDLIQHLQGEQAECPMCGKKTLYDSMVEVGNRSVCANCARDEMADEAGGEDDDEDMEGEEDGEELMKGRGRRRKRLRRPLTLVDVLARILLAVLVLGLVGIGLFYFSPATYSTLRSFLPAEWYFIPTAHYEPPRPATPSRAAEPSGPRVIPSLAFDSPPLRRAIAGVETRHRLLIEGMDDKDGVYNVKVTPAPEGAYTMDRKKGVFAWTPAKADAGKEFTIAFNAVFKNVQSPDQVSRVVVSGGATFRRVGRWAEAGADADAGLALHLLANDFIDGEQEELILVSGDYQRGAVAIIRPGPAGENSVLATVELAGRPVGAGLILADQEKWLAVADYWNSRLRHYAYRNNALSEMAVTIELPGRPLLAGFCLDGSLSAVLCRVGAETRVVLYKQQGQLNSDKLAEWTVPDDYVWRRLFVFRARSEEDRPLVALIGGEFGDSLLLLEDGKPPGRPFRNENLGLLVDAAAERDRRRVHCLVDNQGELFVATIDLERPDAGFGRAKIGAPPALGGLAAIGRDAAGMADLLVLSSRKAAVAFGDTGGSRSDAIDWPLPEPARLFGGPVVMHGPRGPEVVYAGSSGELWAVGLAN